MEPPGPGVRKLYGFSETLHTLPGRPAQVKQLRGSYKGLHLNPREDVARQQSFELGFLYCS